MERIRQEFSTIEPLLTTQQAKILHFMLDTPDGQATHRELTAKVWAGKIPMQDCVRLAVFRLRRALMLHNASHVIFGSRKGVFSFVPTQIEDGT
jgi:DNA-binding winged helix-turn-helix (wHTH) protein